MTKDLKTDAEELKLPWVSMGIYDENGKEYRAGIKMTHLRFSKFLKNEKTKSMVIDKLLETLEKQKEEV